MLERLKIWWYVRSSQNAFPFNVCRSTRGQRFGEEFAVTRLAEMAAVDELISILESGHEWLADSTEKALEGLGARCVVTPLGRALDRGTPCYYRIIRLLGRLGDTNAVAILIKKLWDLSEGGRSMQFPYQVLDVDLLGVDRTGCLCPFRKVVEIQILHFLERLVADPNLGSSVHPSPGDDEQASIICSGIAW